MLTIGLTGGIGSGKSSVSARLAERGAVIVDADAIVHELQAPGGAAFVAMVERFGDGIVGPDGTLDRAAIAEMVFGDSEEAKANLAALNDTVHPLVGAEIANRMAAEAETDHVVILDVPLMVESGRGIGDALIVVDCPVDVAVQRVVEQRGMDEADARNRIARQVSREERLDRADFVIDNSGTVADLDAEVARAWAWIEDLAHGVGREDQ